MKLPTTHVTQEQADKAAAAMQLEPAALKVIDYNVVNKDLNAEARTLRSRIAMRWDPGDLTEYTKCWSEDDIVTDEANPHGRPCKALVVILKTRGCTWALAGGCTMCGYANDSAWTKVSEEQLVAQFARAWKRYAGEELVKIYTSGSFLDRFEVMPGAQKAILETIGKAAKKVAFESLPSFIQDDTFTPLDGICNKLEVGIGVESSNDIVLRDSVNKGHGFASFPKAAVICKRHGVSVKAYVMCKTPFLKESDALTDSTATIIAAAPYSQMVSLNPTNVQGNTIVDALYKKGSYRPPWLWTIVKAVLDGRTAAEAAPGGFHGMLKSDVIAAGQSRGAHNCGKCDETVAGYLKKYKSTQDKKWLAECLAKVECGCRAEWQLTLELGPLIPGYGRL